MLPQSSFKGVWTTLVTPFAADGSVDWLAFDKILDHQLRQNLTGLVVGETTGESMSLASHEKLALVRRAKARTQGKMMVMAGSSGTNTQQVRELSRLCQDAGADCLLVLTPPFIQPSFSGLRKHFETITQGLTIGVFAQYAPLRCGLKLESDELAEILDIDGMLGLKDDSPELELLNELRPKTKKLLLSGNDHSLLEAAIQGADGIISIVSHLFPSVMTEIYQKISRFDINSAQKLFSALKPIIQSLKQENNPAAIKACLFHEGIIQNELRLPLDSINAHAFEKIIINLNETKILLKGASHV